jgi:CheY-like chemotaxis protein
MDTPALADIRDVVNWLRSMEGRISDLYARAAGLCTDDARLSAFLAKLARDESTHADFMAAAAETLGPLQDRPALHIVLDEHTRRQVENLLEHLAHLLDRPNISKSDILEHIARTEASEWNHIFLYVVEEYRKAGREGERAAAALQEHLQYIQGFLEKLPRPMRPSIDVSTLASVSETRFLVVDGYEPLRKLVAALLRRRGIVDTAVEGHEALDRLPQHFHNAIVYDIEMPDMDGLEFYRRAVEYDPHLQGRFLFYAATAKPEMEDYLRRNNLRLLKKPFGLDEFHEAIGQILDPARS